MCSSGSRRAASAAATSTGWTDRTGRRRPPIVMGHEASGTVEKLGAEVTGYQLGRSGHLRLDHLQPGQLLLEEGDDQPVRRPPGAGRLLRGLPAARRLRRAGLGPQPHHVRAAAGHDATSRRRWSSRSRSPCTPRTSRPIATGDTALVFGTGLIGLMTIQVLKHTPAKQIIAVDIDDGKLEVAPRDGRAPHVQPARPLTSPAEVKTADRRPRRRRRLRGAWASRPRCARRSLSVRKGGTVTLVGNLAKDV